MIQIKRCLDVRTGNVRLYNNGLAHYSEAARPTRGMHPAYKAEVNRLLETGHKPAQIMAKIGVERAKTSAAPGAPPAPLYEQLRSAAAEFVKNLPTYKTIHELECALAGHLVKNDQDWLSGTEWDMKILGIYTHKFTEKIGGMKVTKTEPGFVFTSRAIAGNARPLMDAWKDQMAFRVDGTFRLCE